MQCDFGRVKLFVNHFVFAACHFGLDVCDYHFAVFLSFDEGFRVFYFFFFGGFVAFVSSAFKEYGEFAVDAFGGVYAAFGGGTDGIVKLKGVGSGRTAPAKAVAHLFIFATFTVRHAMLHFSSTPL
jgi:hypothetical protein